MSRIRAICIAASLAALLPSPGATQAPKATMGGRVSQEKLLSIDEPTPEAQGLSQTERAALFRAAEMSQVGGGAWTGCSDDPSGNSAAEIMAVQDLNGDGRPEVLIYDSGTFCNGAAGVSSVVMSRTATGSWKLLYSNQGFASFLVSRGVDGFPDIEAGLPGFCFPYFRWDGKEYALVARLDDKGKACEPF